MRKRRKLNVVHHGDPSLEKEQLIDSSNEVNKDGSRIDTHCEKKTRGYTHMLDVWDMPDGEFILVEVDTLGNPMGWEGKTLLNAIGSLSKFRFVPELTEQTTQILKDNMNAKWKQFKHDLKSKGYDESKTEEEMATNVPDKRVDPSQYRALVHHWCSKKGKEISQINKRNRSKFEDLHCMGTKNLPRLIHEMTTKAGGVQPSRAEIYIDTRTRKDGSIVTKKAAATIVELKEHIAEAENLDNSQFTQESRNWKNDTYSKVKGPERRGRVRCLGRLPRHARSNVSSQPTNSEDRLQKVESLLGNLVFVLQMRFSEDPHINAVLQVIAQEVPDFANGSIGINQ